MSTIDAVSVRAYTVPTDAPESDGTAEWDATDVVVVEVRSGATRGLGWTYAPEAAAHLVGSHLAEVVRGRPADDVAALWLECGSRLRNAGRPGIAWCALSALDIAIWDLRARLRGEPLVALLPACRHRVPVYGSGGFCTYGADRVAEQLGTWVAGGIPRVKMKVGREPADDPARIDAARDAIGDAELYVDANGAFAAKEAIRWARRYASDWAVTWFEEPVSSADFDGLRLVRGQTTVDVAAGEYGYVLADFRNLVGAVDCLQADVTRCGGITGLLRVNGLSAAYDLDLSGHCAPQLGAHAFCAVDRLRHLEYFHDHVRVEALLFDGVLEPVDGALVPDRSRPGHGLALKRADAERWAA